MSYPSPPPEPKTPTGWVAIEKPFRGMPSKRKFLHEEGSDRLRLRYFHDTIEDRLRAFAWFGPGSEGPPGHAHGGSIAAVLDEAMGVCTILGGHRVLAGRITVDFEQILPLGTEARVDAWVENIQGRCLHTSGQVTGPDGTCYATATGVFVELNDDGLRRLVPTAEPT